MGNRSSAHEDLGGSLTPDRESTDMIRRKISLDRMLSLTTPEPKTKEVEHIEQLAKIAFFVPHNATREQLENVYEQLHEAGYGVPANYSSAGRVALLDYLKSTIRPDIGLKLFGYSPQAFRELEAQKAETEKQQPR